MYIINTKNGFWHKKLHRNEFVAPRSKILLSTGMFSVSSHGGFDLMKPSLYRITLPDHLSSPPVFVGPALLQICDFRFTCIYVMFHLFRVIEIAVPVDFHHFSDPLVFLRSLYFPLNVKQPSINKLSKQHSNIDKLPYILWLSTCSIKNLKL